MPDRNGGWLNGWPMPPKTRRSRASIISANANVMIRLTSGSLSYSWRIRVFSTSHADRADQERGQKHGGPAEILVQGQREIRAQREEVAVREVHDAQQAEDDRQADGDQHVEATEHQPGGHLRKNDVEHGGVRSYGSRSPPAPNTLSRSATFSGTTPLTSK